MFAKLFICAAILQLALSQDSNDGRIVGGVETTIKEAPYQAAVLVGKFLCGGSIITQFTVITAAHCTAKKSEEDRANAKVRVGSTNYYTGGQLLSVSNIYDHPDYFVDNSDISILEVSTPIFMSQTVGVIGLASSARKTGTFVTVSGWGRTNPTDTSSASDVLRILTVPFLTSDDCRKTFYGKRIKNNMVCAGYTDRSGFDSCQGDSGGPLVQNDELVGVVSWGDGCATAGYPGVYADVFFFRKWIFGVLDEISKYH